MNSSFASQSLIYIIKKTKSTKQITGNIWLVIIIKK